MVGGFQNIFKIPELKKRVLCSFGLLMVYRIGCAVPTPGIDGDALAEQFARAKGTLLGLFDMFSGGALSRMTIFALNVMPYISASIIMQLMTAVVPTLEELKKEGETGRKNNPWVDRSGDEPKQHQVGAALRAEEMAAHQHAVPVRDHADRAPMARQDEQPVLVEAGVQKPVGPEAPDRQPLVPTIEHALGQQDATIGQLHEPVHPGSLGLHGHGLPCRSRCPADPTRRGRTPWRRCRRWGGW